MSGELATLLVRALAKPGVRISEPGGTAWEGGDLLASARRTARFLTLRRIVPNEPVHVAIANRPEDLAALLGVWLAAGVGVPVDRASPAPAARRLQRITGARFQVDAGEVLALAHGTPPGHPLPHDSALVLFTSGSTGRAKGVVLSHAALAGKLAVLGRLLQPRPDDVLVVPLRLTFIFGLWVSLLGLLAGARLMLMPRFTGDAVGHALAAGGTILAAVPTMLRILSLGIPRPEGAPPAPRLRMILSGGELLGPNLGRVVRDAWPEAGLFDLYGSTETGSCDFCLPPPEQPDGFGTIGRPTAGVAFRLGPGGGPDLDAGELQIRTPFGMLGYLGDPATTAAAFEDGFFRTGDLARLRPDGRVELVGRIKEIIVRGGSKIAPAEVEALFGSHPEIAAALCAGVPDARVGEAVHVMLVPRPGAAPSPDALHAWAADRIERYKLPDRIHLADALPLGPTGKTDRKALARMIGTAG